MNTLKQSLRKYGTFIAAGAMLLIGLVALATVWFLQQAEGPVAPTAPSSIPQAAGNQCSIQWGVQNECESMAIQNADTGEAIEPGSSISVGTKVTISCEGLKGTNYYKYRYSLSGGAPFTEFAAGKMVPSPVLDTATMNITGPTSLTLRCRPFAGDWGALMTTVQANCTNTLTLQPEATPSPSPSPSVSPSPSPSVSPSPSPSVSPSPSPSPSPTPLSCSNTCSTTAQCSSGLICSGGLCRNPSCTAQTNCICPTPTPSPTPVSCNNGCSSNSNCSSGLICSGGVCRNPSCTNESDCTCNTPTPTATPTPTPLAGCSNSCVTSSDCNAGLTCSGGVCRNPSCTNQTNCVCQIAQATPTPAPGAPAATPTPTPQQELPQAGSTAQTIALLTLGVGVIGMGAFRFYAMKR